MRNVVAFAFVSVVTPCFSMWCDGACSTAHTAGYCNVMGNSSGFNARGYSEHDLYNRRTVSFGSNASTLTPVRNNSGFNALDDIVSALDVECPTFSADIMEQLNDRIEAFVVFVNKEKSINFGNYAFLMQLFEGVIMTLQIVYSKHAEAFKEGINAITNLDKKAALKEKLKSVKIKIE